MRRTQLFLEDDLWKALHIQAGQLGTTVSELARQALREKYSNPDSRRREAMEAAIGVWKDRGDMGSTENYIRRLRNGSRRRKALER